MTVSGVGLFALISIPCSSLAHSISWELKWAEQADSCKPCFSIGFYVNLAYRRHWQETGAGGAEMPRCFCPWLSVSCGISHRGGSSSWFWILSERTALVPPSAMGPASWAWKNCPGPWLSSPRPGGGSFLLWLISGCLDVLCLASQFFHYLYNPFLKFCLKCLMINVFLMGYWFNQEKQSLHHGSLLNREQYFHST